MLRTISQSLTLLLLLSVFYQSGFAQSKPLEMKPTPTPAPMAPERGSATQFVPQDKNLEQPSILLHLFIFSVTDKGASKKPIDIAKYVESEYAKGLANDKSKREFSEFQIELSRTLEDPSLGFQVLSRPSMMLVAEKPGVIQIGSEVPMQYMVPAKDGLFELKKTEPLKLGLEISIKAEEPQTQWIDGKEIKTTILKPLLFSMSTMDGRMEYPGVDLQIGHPRVSTRFLETGLSLKEKTPTLVELPSDERHSVFLLVWFEIPDLN